MNIKKIEKIENVFYKTLGVCWVLFWVISLYLQVGEYTKGPYLIGWSEFSEIICCLAIVPMYIGYKIKK